MEQAATFLMVLLTEPTFAVVAICLAALVVAGMSVYGMTIAIKAKRVNNGVGKIPDALD